MNMYFCLIVMFIICGILLLIYRKTDKIIEQFETELLPDLSQTYNSLNKDLTDETDDEIKKECNKNIPKQNNLEDNSKLVQTNINDLSFAKINLKDYIHKDLVPKNIDLSKYILKSEIPTCQAFPDMSDFILKSNIPSTPNMNEYIKKNLIPKCSILPDMSKYILKSEVHSCPKQLDLSKFVLKSSIPPPIPPTICPSCPRCPSPCHKVKKIITCKNQPLVCKPASINEKEIIKIENNKNVKQKTRNLYVDVKILKPNVNKNNKNNVDKNNVNKNNVNKIQNKNKNNIDKNNKNKNNVNKNNVDKNNVNKIQNKKKFNYYTFLKTQFNKTISNIFLNKKNKLSNSTKNNHKNKNYKDKKNKLSNSTNNNNNKKKNHKIKKNKNKNKNKNCKSNNLYVKKSGVYGPY